MTSPSHPSPNLAPLLHLLTGALLGTGLVGIALWQQPRTAAPVAAFNRSLRGLPEWAVLGAIGGLLGGSAFGLRPAGVPGIRFWMLAVGTGRALTLGTVALRDAQAVPVSENGGPATHVLIWLVVGWLTGILFGAVGSAFARSVSPVMTAALRWATTGRPERQAKVVGAILGGAAWAVFWGILVTLLVLLTLAVVLLSLRPGGEGPALAVGGTCGCVFFGLRYALTKGG